LNEALTKHMEEKLEKEKPTENAEANPEEKADEEK
jgi:hypothetical protein